MIRPLLEVDYNEMLESNLVLLSSSDIKIDYYGHEIALQEGLDITIYSDDSTDDQGNPEYMIADGVVEMNRSGGWSSHVKWCCRIDNNGILYKSQLT